MKKINNIQINSRRTLCIICFLAAIMHLTYIIVFWKFKIDLLMYVNFVSTSFYIVTAIVAISKNATKHLMVWIISILSEVAMHAVLCTLVLGVDTFFILFPIAALPVCIFYLFFYTRRETFSRTLIILVIIIAAITAATVILADYFDGIYFTDYNILSRNEHKCLRSINIFFSTFMLFGFTLMFYIELSHMFDKLKDSNEKLQFTATHDALTGLTNRRSFWDFFDKLCIKDEHYNVAMGDLDSFKHINDTYGHGCGDLVLKSVADIIIKSARDGEIACRWGGEEMVVVFLGDRLTALERVEKIRSRIENLTLTYEGLTVHVTMTFGFADSGEIRRAIELSQIEKNSDTEVVSMRYGVESLISLVDKRLYFGKNHGKNKVVDR